MPNPVVHFEILGKDAPKLQAYYAKLFGWEINNNPMNYGMVDTKAGGIQGGIGEGQGRNLVTVYVEVQDIHAALKQAESLGGKVIMPVMEVPGAVTMAQFADPEGNIVGLVLPWKPESAK